MGTSGGSTGPVQDLELGPGVRKITHPKFVASKISDVLTFKRLP